MRINEVERLVGITKRNIRFYEKEGLLSPGRSSEICRWRKFGGFRRGRSMWRTP